MLADWLGSQVERFSEIRDRANCMGCVEDRCLSGFEATSRSKRHGNSAIIAVDLVKRQLVDGDAYFIRQNVETVYAWLGVVYAWPQRTSVRQRSVRHFIREYPAQPPHRWGYFLHTMYSDTKSCASPARLVPG